jgi:hypothetical protein
MDFEKFIEVQWCGIRKDSGKGAVWGWFVETGKSTSFGKEFNFTTRRYEELKNPCYEFWGSFGKKLQISENIITPELLSSFKQKERNYKQIEFQKIRQKWSSKFDKELEEFIFFQTLKNGN